MEYRTFGNTELSCSAIGFGTWEMGTTQYGAIDIDEAIGAVQMAIDHGVTLFDTAEVYGPYISEELLARALGHRRQDVVLVTKVGYTFADDAAVSGNDAIIGTDASAAHITARAEGCLKRLNTDTIDLLLIHESDKKTPHEETMAALEALKSAGKIRHYGVSNYTLPMMRDCQEHGHLAASQLGYHLFDRRMEAEMLPYCLEQGIGFMAYGSLGFGLLTGAMTPETTFVDWDWRSKGVAVGLPLFEREHFLRELRVVERLKALAADYGKSVAQLAIAWILGHPAVTVALVGMRNEQELRENIAAVNWQLSGGDREAIDRIFAEEGVPTYVDAKHIV